MFTMMVIVPRSDPRSEAADNLLIVIPPLLTRFPPRGRSGSPRRKNWPPCCASVRLCLSQFMRPAGLALSRNDAGWQSPRSPRSGCLQQGASL